MPNASIRRFVVGSLVVVALAVTVWSAVAQAGPTATPVATPTPTPTGTPTATPNTTLFPCSEQGIQAAITFGGGPHKFFCSGPTTVVTTATIVIDNDVILDGEGKLIIDGNNSHRVLFVSPDITVELHNMTITRGLAPTSGGTSGAGIENHAQLTLYNVSLLDNNRGAGTGVANFSYVGETPGSLTMINCVVAGNIGDYAGGGILNDTFSTLTMIDSVISGNEVLGGSGDGGAIYNVGVVAISGSTISGNRAAYGGGLHNKGDGWEAQFTITNTTISDNVAAIQGGGIYNYGSTLHNGGKGSITNSTISGNSAGDDGGGIFDLIGETEIISSTFSGNTADGMPEGIWGSLGSPLVRNSVIDGTCEFGLLTSDGGNIESPGNTCSLTAPGDQVSVSALDLALGPLTDNGGLTETHALLMGSVAIDAAVNCPPPDTDQRGFVRPHLGTCDSGAVEYLSAPPPTPTPTATPTSTPTATPIRSEKVTMCHNGKHSISASTKAMPAHLAHGDTLGACP